MAKCVLDLEGERKINHEVCNSLPRLRIFYHQGECLLLHLRPATPEVDGDEILAEVVARLGAVTQGSHTQVPFSISLPMINLYAVVRKIPSQMIEIGECMDLCPKMHMVKMSIPFL